MNGHVHISALNVAVFTLSVLVGLGVLNIIALRFKGHPLPDAFLDIYGSGSR